MTSTGKGPVFISTPLEVVLETNNILVVHLSLETPITGKLEALAEGKNEERAPPVLRGSMLNLM